MLAHIRHSVSGRSTPSVSSSLASCRNPSWGDTDTMVRASEHYPRALFRPIPTWFRELTYEPISRTVRKGMNAA